MKSLQGFIERYLPKLAKHRRFRAIHSTSLTTLRDQRLFEPELKLVEAFIGGRDGICLDVGAHVGEYCAVLEKVVSTEKIYAFEPNEKTCVTLRRLFPKIHVESIALSDSSGTATINIPIMKGRQYDTRGTLESHTEPNQEGVETMQIHTERLDAFVRNIGDPHLNFLKIDVEGHEMKVIKGGEGVIRKDKPIMLVEIEQRHHTEPIADVFKMIEDWGYFGFYFSLADFSFHPASEFSVSLQQYENLKTVHYINNFLFFPKEEAPSILKKLEEAL